MDNARTARRLKDFCRPPDVEDLRRRREEDHVQLRKSQRSDNFAKRRISTKSPLFQDLPAKLREAIPQLADMTLTAHTKAVVLVEFLKKPRKPEALFDAVQFLRKIISTEGAAARKLIPVLINANVLDCISDFLSSEEVGIKTEALWCLLNLASESTEIVQKVARPDILAKVVGLMGSPDTSVVVHAFWAIGNISGDSPALRDSTLSAGALSHALSAAWKFELYSAEQQRNMVWVLGNLFRGGPAIRKDLVFDCVSLVMAIHKVNKYVVEDLTWVMQNISESDIGAKAIICAGVVPLLVSLMSHPDIKVASGALRACGNLLLSSNNDVDKVLEAGYLDELRCMTTAPSVTIRREVLWSLSNLLVGSPQQIEACIKHPIFRFVLSSATIGNFDVQNELVFCLYHAVTAGAEFALYLADMGVLEALISIIGCSQCEGVILRALETIDCVLTAGMREAETYQGAGNNKEAVKFEELGGLSKLESLQTHPSGLVYKKCVQIMDLHYGLVEATLDESPVSVPTTGFQFS